MGGRNNFLVIGDLGFSWIVVDVLYFALEIS
jgi:hypothetical protein